MKKYNFKKSGTLILGVNGWSNEGHDASAALIHIDGDSCEVLGALEEEKVIEQKCAYDVFPVESIRILLESFHLTPEDIDHIAYGWDYPELYKIKGEKMPYTETELRKELFKIGTEIPVHFINHHLSHAACSYRTSCFDRSLVFVLDGQGEDESNTVWLGEGQSLELLEEMPIETSLGYLYEAVNLVLGFKNHESGKTMGLAAYGKPVYFEALLKCFKESETGFSLGEVMAKYKKLAKRFLPDESVNSQGLVVTMWRYVLNTVLEIEDLETPMTSFALVEETYKNLAASVQYLLEYLVCNMIKKYVNRTGIRNITMGGGVALNCTLNGKILAMEEVDNIFINPAANDAGVSLGAALELAKELGLYSLADKSVFSPFLGSEYDSEEVARKLQDMNEQFTVVEDASQTVAEALASGRIVAVFQGRNEWGPRALGGRSILSLAVDRDRLDFINSQVKSRELGRPLGPSLICEDAGELITVPKILGKYMNVAYKSDTDIEKYPTVIHVDDTFRPEFVDSEYNKKYYSQLSTLKGITGSSVVVNTSFNLETPIIYTVEKAVEFFRQSKIDMLVFNNEVILKKEV